MKASILILTILGMIAINVVTGGPIEDPKQEASSENINRNGDISDIDVHSRRKRSNGVNTRLVGGSDNNEGRVEIYHDGKWGTVCDDSWDIDDARVVCKSLGFYDATEAKKSAYFGQGSGNVWLDDVNCDGTEPNLMQCSHPGLGVENCGHGEDAGVICSEIVVYGDIRSNSVYYQVAHTTGRLDCYYSRKGEYRWTGDSGRSTYNSGYAECGGWEKGNPDYFHIKLYLNGKEHFTNEETAISKGPYPSTEEYLKTPNRFCTPSQLMNAKILSGAKTECVDTPSCDMFFDEAGNGKRFFACENTASIKESTFGTVLYQNDAWTVKENMHCTASIYGDRYDNLDAAMNACQSDTDCAAIYDSFCRGSEYSLCGLNYQEERSSSGSCLRIKPE